MKEAVKYMKRYIDKVDTKKSNLVFCESTGKEDIHEYDMENRMPVLYEFFNFFKIYSFTYLFQSIYFSNPRGTRLLSDGSNSPRGVRKIYSEITLSSDFGTIGFKNSMKHLCRIGRTSGEYAYFTVGIEGIGTEILTSDIGIYPIYKS